MIKLFFKYVSRSIIGLIGISIYAVVDTFFIAKCSGADGIATLNLSLPLYWILYAIGAMIGIGSATNYAIKKANNKKNIETYFSQAIIWQFIVSIPFILLGIFSPESFLYIMGGDEKIISLGTDYVRIVLIGAPFFMIDYTFTAFARNDKAPTIVMIANLAASLFNVVFDYVFMFVLNMGIAGAALATAMAPIVSCMVCCVHYFSEKSNIKFLKVIPSIKLIIENCSIGLSAFIIEISSAIIVTIYNYLLIDKVGNIAVAAYGIVTNYAIVPIAIFNGIAQGIQPLLSSKYGNDKNNIKTIFRMGIISSLVVSVLCVTIIYIFTNPLIAVYNNENNIELIKYANSALKLYFLGYIFAGINIVVIAYFAAVGDVFRSSLLSILRGVVVISICAIVMAIFFGLKGIWLSYCVAEIIVFIISIIFMLWVPLII